MKRTTLLLALAVFAMAVLLSTGAALAQTSSLAPFCYQVGQSRYRRWAVQWAGWGRHRLFGERLRRRKWQPSRPEV
jgi:hypothetical protein